MKRRSGISGQYYVLRNCYERSLVVVAIGQQDLVDELAV